MSTAPSIPRSPDKTKFRFRLSDWVEAALWIDGMPFRFRDRPYLFRPYDAMTPAKLMKCARAAEKSTFLCNMMVSFCSNFPLFRVLYASASMKQSMDFSRDQLKPRLQSPWVRERHFDPRICDDNMEYKEFTNGSRIRLRHMYHTPDRVRGLRVDLLCVDELQDIDTRFLPIVRECLVQSPWALSTYSGTPKTFDNPIEYYWEQSTREEWEIKCPGCWRWQEGGLGLNNIGKNGPICRYCKRGLDVRYGQWVAYGDNLDRPGFRVPQLMIPYFQDPDRWRTKILEDLGNYSQAQFHNEVLGLSYDQADKPVTEADIRKCCTGKWCPTRPPELSPSIPLFMGIDWGTGGSSKTVIVVGGFVGRHKFQFFWGHIFRPNEFPDPDDLLDEIVRVADHWGVRAVGSDWGFGAFENKRLRAMVGDDRLWEFQNVGQQRADCKWNPQAGLFTHNVTKTLSDFFVGIKEERLMFPHWGEWEGFAKHFLNVRREYNLHTGHSSYVNSEDRPDDAAHACNYAWMAGRLVVHQWLQRSIKDVSHQTAQEMPIPPFLRR